MNTELMDRIIRAILPDNSDRLYYAMERLDPSSFTGEHSDLFKIIIAVHGITSGSIVDAPTLERLLEAQPEGKLSTESKIRIEDLWTRLSESPPVTEPEFRSCVELLLDGIREANLGEALRDTAKIIDSGINQGKLYLHGVDDAVSYLLERVSDIESKSHTPTMESDVMAEASDILKEVYEGASVSRIPTGIVPVDEMTHGGIGDGELAMIGAYTGVGKSLLAVNMAWNFIVSGHNVVYVSLEMPSHQVRRRMIIRHALHEKFGPGGLSLTAVNNHKPDDPCLSEEQLRKFADVVDDFTNNPAHGRLVIVQCERDSRFSTVRGLLNRWQNKMNIDAVIIDSLDLVSADTKRSSRRDELNEVILSGKHLAMSFNDGIPVITPWQTSRDALRNANSDYSDGSYNITAMAETSEAERRADLILALLQRVDTPTRLKVQTLKWRDGEPKDFDLKVDYDKCYIGSDKSLFNDDSSSYL